MEDFLLPNLHPLIRIYPSDNKISGEPQWILYQPLTNKFFKIGWKEFECIGRFHKCDDVHSLISMVKDETNLEVDLEDLKSLVIFLQGNGLLKNMPSSLKQDDDKPLIKRLFHGYLYFTIPLISPQKYLDRFYPLIKSLFTKNFFIFTLLTLLIGTVMTLPRIDEFLNTFSNIVTIEGAIVTFFSLILIKIIHEFSHAFMATKYGVKVPSMGMAFIVLYPILYTEGTHAWKIRDKYARAHIGMAGIYAEVMIAAIALILWNFTSAGLLQMMLFSTVAISLLGSLFVNLNPLMRFDGYYVLSDLTGIDNLHSTAIDYARNKIRRFLFGLCDPLSYDNPPQTVRWLTFFGVFVLIYRFFLFFGIAILVYHMFMKPLGLVAMVLELAWFIGMPLLSELKVWWERRYDIVANARGKCVLLVCVLFSILFFVPVNSSIHAPAVIHSLEYRDYYPVKDAIISDVYVVGSQRVKKGGRLISLSSPILEKELRIAKVEVDNLQSIKRREQTNVELYRSRRGLIDQQIIAAQSHYQNLKEQEESLSLIADFDGVVFDLLPDVRKGQNVNTDQLLMTLVSPEDQIITAYVSENDTLRIKIGDTVDFRDNSQLFSSIKGRVSEIETVNVHELNFPVLASTHGGSILSHIEKERLKPVHALYRVKITPVNVSQAMDSRVIGGIVKIQGEKMSSFSKISSYFSRLYRENVNFN